MNTRLNGRSNRKTMSTKKSSRPNTPIKESGKVEKIPKKNQSDDKVILPKHLVIEEETVEKEENAVVTKEVMNGDGQSPSKDRKEENGEKLENGTNGDAKLEESIKHDGTNGKESITTNGNQENGSGEPVKTNQDVVEESNDKTEGFMEEPVLTLSEDDEKLSIHDSFESECSFDGSPTASSPSSNRSITRRSQVVKMPTPETPKITKESTESVLAKATTSNEEDCIIVDESDDTNTDTESSTTPLDQKVSSTEVVQDIQHVNASLIANYSGNTTLDLTIEETSNTNASNFSDSLNATTESPSYSRSLRSISGRKSLRPLREVSFRNAKRLADASLYKKDDTQTSMNVTVNTELNTSIGSRVNRSLKRERSKTPNEEDDSKRMKTDASTADFIRNFIPSPMAALKRRFYSSKISSSTPKKQCEIENDQDGEITENRLEVYTGNETKKNWCVIM